MKKYVSIKNAQWMNEMNLHSAMLLKTQYSPTTALTQTLIRIGIYSYVAVGVTIIVVKTSQYLLRKIL